MSLETENTKQPSSLYRILTGHPVPGSKYYPVVDLMFSKIYSYPCPLNPSKELFKFLRKLKSDTPLVIVWELSLSIYNAYYSPFLPCLCAF